MTMVIIGASLAGAKTAQALREQGHDGDVILIGGESHHPYERPPLSKQYLAGKYDRDKLFVHESPAWYVENRIGLRLGRTAVAVDRHAHTVELDDGERIEYSKLLFATGSSPRRLGIPGGDAPNLRYLRTIADSEAMRASFRSGSRLLVVGAGWIGLEVTAAAREAGVEVTVLEAAELPLLRAIGPEVAVKFADLHRAHGVDLRLGVKIEEFVLDGDGRAVGVRTEGDGVVEADEILVAIGAAPNTDLADAAGLPVEQGIIVDATLRTEDPDVFAAGDVARAWHPFYQESIRVEHWANALNQPAVASASMLGVTDLEYTRLPYFFTDQYDLGMEYTGYVPSSGYDRMVFRGDPDSGEYIALWLAKGQVLAGMNVNVWDVTDAIKALITSRSVVDPEQLADTSVPLASLVDTEDSL